VTAVRLLAAIPRGSGGVGAEVTGLTGEGEPTPGERLPPGKLRLELRWPTECEPELQRQSDVVEVVGEEALLELGGGGEDGLPEPSGPAEM